MTPLHDRVRRAIERDRLLPPGTRVLAAVSGGADSVALLHLLRQLAPACGFVLAGLAHVNHQLRGAESDGDERFCRDLAGRLDLPCEVGSADVAAQAREAHVSIEVAARRTRYAWFTEAAARLGADRVATGHTQDDQAETVLLRLLRGAGASGLAGIRPVRGMFVRPLLDCRRRDLIAFLDHACEPYREDSSNQDLSIPRNWIRHQLLPSLADHLDADIRAVLARQALILKDESALLDTLAEQAWPSVATRSAPGVVALSADRLQALPVAIARRLVRDALKRVNETRSVGFDHVEKVIALASGEDPASAADLPGIRLERKPPEVVLSSRGPRAERVSAGFNYRLQVPGSLEIPECGCVIDARVATSSDAQAFIEKGVTTLTEAFVDVDAAVDGLWVRSRRPGDWVRPLGLGGRKKLQDVLVDRKVPREQRDRVPIVVDARDRILWVAGQARADEACVTDRTRSVVTLSLRELGES